MKPSRIHPVLLSVIYAVLILFFVAAAGVVSAIFHLDEIQTILLQTASFLLSIIAGFFLMRKSGYSLSQYGFCISSRANNQNALWFIPLLLVEVSAFIVGLRDGITLTYFVSVLLFTLSVGVGEEMYFRGLILKLLSTKGVKFAAIVSSVIFGIVHLGNLAGGADMLYTLLQVLFAALFGLVCAEIVIITKSILMVIIWHFLHDFIAYVTAPELSGMALIILGFQCAVLFGYSVYLWRKIKSE